VDSPKLLISAKILLERKGVQSNGI